MLRLYKYIFLLCLLSSCVKEDDLGDTLLPDEVEVGIKFNVIGEDAETKTIVDPMIEASTKIQDIIQNFWVLQYDGSGNDARLVGEPKYYSDMDIFLKTKEEGGYGGSIKLVRSSGRNRIVVLANTFDPLMTFPKESNFADLKKRWRAVTGPESFLSLSEDNRYITFSGSVVVSVSDNVSISCPLRRNVAKMVLKLINSSENVTINSWQIRNVPSISYFFTDYDLPYLFPGLGDFTSVDFPVFTPEEPLSPKVDASATSSSMEYVLYLPINKRGIDERVESESRKNFYAPNNATYLQVNAAYDGGVPIQYTFYLGQNLTTDFNILPNHSYEFEFIINSKGDAAVDTRVKELGLVDFTKVELANCYVINPAQAEGVRRKFMIPVGRVDEFWGGNGYENNSNYTLGSNKTWNVKILATNFDNSAGQLEITKSEGTGKDDFFTFTVAPGTVGNAIVALYTGDDQACWSWHLWITDYSPDEAFTKTPQAGVYSYSVTGGNVHRYEGKIWEGEYARRFIMDRNLGAVNTAYNKNEKGTMYFQFGRKDPFFGNASDCFDSQGRKSTVGSTFGIMPTSDFTNNDQPVPYSVHNPLDMIYYNNPNNSSDTRGEWTSGNKYNPADYDKTIIWQDPQTASKGSNPGGKSIFDPCPPGYCVPKNGTWADFRINNDDRPTTNVRPADTGMKRGFKPFSEFLCYYWPYPASSEDDKAPAEPVFYPMSGFKDRSHNVGSYQSYLYSYSSTPSSKKNGFALSIYGNSDPSKESISTSNSFPRNLAFPVRCVTSRDADL